MANKTRNAIEMSGQKWTPRKGKPKLKPGERACGTCQACCGPLFAVPEIGKAIGDECTHKAQKGCGIYENRPQACRDFRCLWHYGLMRGELRPDRCGIIVTLTEEGAPGLPPGVQALVIREVRPGASKEGEGSWYIQEMARTNLIIVIEGGSRLLLGPQHLVRSAQALLMNRLANEPTNG